jgi:uncharacterized protein involved in outer membrane biogenesis
MSTRNRNILITIVALLGLIVLACASLVFFLDTGAYRARLEAQASAALGLQVSIGGAVRINLFPVVRVHVEDVRLRNRDADVASAKRAELDIELLPLLRQHVQITKIGLRQMRISVERDHEGRFNFAQPQATEDVLPALDLPSVTIDEGTFIFADKRLARAFEAVGCRLAVQGLRQASGKHADLMTNLAFKADLECSELRNESVKVSDLKFSVEARQGILDFKPIAMRVFDTLGSGRLQADFSGAVPRYNAEASLTQFPIEAFFKTLALQPAAEGRVDFTAHLTMQGQTEIELRRTANGRLTLRGKSLKLNGRDVDEALSRFESSQTFNLVDAGAFFFAGPLGLVLTKGYDFASIYRGTAGSSEIRVLVSDWTLEHGRAQAHDVAMATRANRIALQGGLDLVNHRFDDVTMALIDPKGCAKVRQKIHGTFEQPAVDKPNALAALAGPAIRLLKKGGELLGAKCDVFYAGSVPAPG